MEDRLSQLDVAKVTRTFGHVLSARLALELAVDRAESRIVQAKFTGLRFLGVHRLGVLDVRDAHRLDFIRRQESELDLLDRLNRRIRVRKVKVRHLVRFFFGIMYRNESRRRWFEAEFE